jgi:hypothetical protein
MQATDATNESVSEGGELTEYEMTDSFTKLDLEPKKANKEAEKRMVWVDRQEKSRAKKYRQRASRRCRSSARKAK